VRGHGLKAAGTIAVRRRGEGRCRQKRMTIWRCGEGRRWPKKDANMAVRQGKTPAKQKDAEMAARRGKMPAKREG
jgi:hypothetical protein